MIIETWDRAKKQWVVKKVAEQDAILDEIDKMDSIEQVGNDYRKACVDVLNTLTMIYVDQYKPTRN